MKKHMREILPHRLFLGNAFAARDLKGLYDSGISAVVDLALDEPVAQLSRELVYCRFPIVDGDGNSDALLEAAIQCLVTLIEQRFRVLAACSAGMSRSPTISAAALAQVTDRDPDQCLAAIVAGAPHDVSPALWSAIKSVYGRMCNTTKRE